MSNTPWFQFYSSDWLAGTRGLSAVETGIYITLIASMYDRSAPIKNDNERLSRLCGASPRQFKLACQKLIDEGKIILTKDGLWNHKVAEQLQLRAARTGKAKTSANARWNDKSEQNQQEVDANALPEQSSNDAIQNQNHKELRKEDTKKYLPKEKRGTRLPDDFVPDASCQAVAEKMGFTRQQSQLEFEKFKDYFNAKPGAAGAKLDWQATFRNWLRNAKPQKDFSNGNQQKPEHRATVAADKLRAELGLEPTSEGFRFDK